MTLLQPERAAGPFASVAEEKEFLVRWIAETNSVHGRPLTVTAHFKRATKAGERVFAIYCSACVGKTCSWAPVAAYKSGMWQLRGHVTASHGEPRSELERRGRRCAGASQYATITHWTHTGAAFGKDALQKEVNKELGQRYNFTVGYHKPTGSSKKRALETGFKCVSWVQCRSHLTAEGRPCPWAGTVQYNEAARSILVSGRPLGDHAERPNLKRRAFTTQQERVLRKHAEAHGRRVHARQAHVALCSPRKCPNPSRPGAPETPRFKMRQVAGFLDRCRRARQIKIPTQPSAVRRAFDFRVLERSLRPCGPSEVQPSDEDLRAIAWDLDSDVPRLTLLSPAQISETFAKLVNRRQVKVCMDGKERTLGGGWKLISVGILGKAWSEAACGADATPSTYFELGYRLAPVENADAFYELLQDVIAVCKAMGIDFKARDIAQWHGDMAKGIARARQMINPAAIAVADWAHVTGATTDGRTGLLHTLKSAMTTVDENGNKPHYPFARDWVIAARCLPIRQLFHIVVQSVLRHLDDVEPAAAKKFRAHASMTRPRVALPPSSRNREHAPVYWDADWRIGHDRVAIGTATGSSPEEAYNNHCLSTVLGNTHRAPEPMIEDLQRLNRSRLVQLRNEVDEIGDWPATGPFWDLPCLRGNLRRFGRSNAMELLESGNALQHHDAVGNVWYMFPKSLWEETGGEHSDGAAACIRGRHNKSYRPRSIQTLPPGTIEQMTSLLKASTADAVIAALLALQVVSVQGEEPLISDWARAGDIFVSWCTVVIGPMAAEKWKACSPNADTEHPHTQVLCSFCTETMKRGPCEHAYAALLSEGMIPSHIMMHNARRGRPRSDNPGFVPRFAGLVPVIQPTGDREPAAAVEPPRSACLRAEESLDVARVRELLRASGLVTPARMDVVNSQKVTLLTIANSDINSLCFRLSVVWGEAEALQRAARAALQGSGSSMVARSSPAAASADEQTTTHPPHANAVTAAPCGSAAAGTISSSSRRKADRRPCPEIAYLDWTFVLPTWHASMTHVLDNTEPDYHKVSCGKKINMQASNHAPWHTVRWFVY